jgi:hypothetical protein
MYEFETFGYLDVQKTGSSFISAVLNKFCTEKLTRKKLHAGLDSSYDPQKFYFISVRDPVDLYVSLFSYGCQAKGKLFRRLYQRDLGTLYDGTWGGFQFWLEFILDPANAHFLEASYSREVEGLSAMIGYQSYRVLSLSIPDAIHQLATCGSSAEVKSLYESGSVIGYAIRYEQFCEDICTLLRDRLQHSVPNLDDALHYVQTQKARNPSDRIDKYETRPVLGKALKRQLQDREWLLHESFGY